MNAAHAFLAEGCETSEAVARLSKRFGMSQRQACRYVQTARTMSGPVTSRERSVPVTLKLPIGMASSLRAYARRSGLTTGEIVSRALARVPRGAGETMGVSRHGPRLHKSVLLRSRL